jgi:hypothetical protein
VFNKKCVQQDNALPPSRLSKLLGLTFSRAAGWLSPADADRGGGHDRTRIGAGGPHAPRQRTSGMRRRVAAGKRAPLTLEEIEA